ncbi:MAG: TonB family protein [Myxococcota bacterium]
MLAALMALALPARAQPAPEPDPGAPAEEPALVAGPAIAAYVEAPYPPEAEAAGIEGTVKLRISLSAAGEVDEVEVIEPAGHGFDEAAVDAVLAMEWTPARTAEGPVPVVFDFDYGFVLREQAPTPDPAAPLPVNLDGELVEMATRDPIAGAVVTVTAVDGQPVDAEALPGAELSAQTDEQGRFALRGVPTGQAHLTVRHVGHVSEERDVEVVEGQATTLKLWMRAEAYRDNEIVALYDRPQDEVTRRTITIDEVKRIPGTFGDPVKVIQTLPGAARTPFGTGLLVIRGADPEDSGVYIDGIRIPLIYHLTGTTSVLSPDLIEAVDYLPGGYGVQFGRTMGGTVNVRTKTTFDQDEIVWGTDILDSQIYYQGHPDKKDKHGLAIGFRRSYIDLFIPLFLGNTDYVLKPRYWDYQLKWIPELPHDEFSVFVYGFDDLLRVATPADVAQGSDQDTQGALAVRYNSHRALVRWMHPFSERLSMELLPSVGIDSGETGLGQDFGLRSTNLLTQLRGQLSWTPFPELEVVPGTDVLGGVWGFDFLSAINIEAIDDPLAERERVQFSGNGALLSPDVFLRANLRPLDHGSERLLISPGVRANLVGFTTRGELAGTEPLPPTLDASLDPRILGRWQVVEDQFALKAATGLYNQPPQPQEALGVGTGATTSFERSWSTTFGWEQRLTPAIHYDVDLFYRQMDRLIVFDEAWTGFGSNPFVNGGAGRAYGLEIMARHDPVGPFFGWVSYTLSRAARRDPYVCTEGDPSDENLLLGTGPCWYRFDFDQTHIFSAQAGYDLPFDFGISAQVQYVTGNPASLYDTGVYDADSDFYNPFRVGQINEDRLPPYFQTSLRFDKLWTFRTWQLDTYVDLLNAVRGVNAEFTLYNFDYTEAAYLRGLPFIPNIGIEAKFYP